MTRVLVVHHDVDVADGEVESLRRMGYEARSCAGPAGGGHIPCPVYSGNPCWMAEEADVLVYDVWSAADGDAALVNHLRAVHPDKPVVVTSAGLPPSWSEPDDAHVVLLTGSPTGLRLDAAIKQAIAGA